MRLRFLGEVTRSESRWSAFLLGLVGRSSSLLGEVTRVALGRAVSLGGLVGPAVMLCSVVTLSGVCAGFRFMDTTLCWVWLSFVVRLALVCSLSGESGLLVGFLGDDVPSWDGMRRLGRV